MAKGSLKAFVKLMLSQVGAKPTGKNFAKFLKHYVETHPMNQNDTTQSLIHHFSFPKPADVIAKQDPGSAKESKPNHSKVGPISNGLVRGVLQANAGWGTLYASGMEFVRKAALLILAHCDEDKFDVTKQTIVTQLTVLQDHIKGWSVQGAKSDYKAWTDAMVAKAPKGAVGEEVPVATDKPIAISGNETEDELKAKLAAAMADIDDPKKGPGSVN